MPVYTVYHRSYISASNREKVARGLTELHTSVTGAESQVVKVMFLELDSDNIFVGGERVNEYVRAVGQIRQGRTHAQKHEILEGMYSILREIIPAGEVQTQILEIDDTKTVMTDGVMNA